VDRNSGQESFGIGNLGSKSGLFFLGGAADLFYAFEIQFSFKTGLACFGADFCSGQSVGFNVGRFDLRRPGHLHCNH